ncbi:MAG: hypothetical protein IPN90_08070 [Elusimicrobia bacterium]|nr:hypothetical protein [Elusimicrobiota bacterium]
MDHGREGGPAGLITVAGGKMSDFRLMAQEAVDSAGRWLGTFGECRTAALTLEGERVSETPAGGPPPKKLKEFLDHHPRLREGHALAYLGAAYGRHLLSHVRESTLGDVLIHYENKS